MAQQKKVLYLNAQDLIDYYNGEAHGRRDGAAKWGMADTRSMTEQQAAGYRDGYYSNIAL